MLSGTFAFGEESAPFASVHTFYTSRHHLAMPWPRRIGKQKGDNVMFLKHCPRTKIMLENEKKMYLRNPRS